MSRLDRKVRRLQRRNSQSHAVFLLVVLLMFVGVAIFVRLYVFEPVKIMDTSMAPKFKERSVVWMCKIPQCFANLEDQKIVWAKLNSDETQVRSILGMPGDSIEISDKGKVKSQHRNFKWRGEDAFIQTRRIYVPKNGDTLIFSELNDVEQDYIISYLRDKGENVLVKTTLWQGEREINIERVGSTKIANRQVSLNEIDFLPWQDRYLIEEQIRLSEPGNAPIKLKRQLFYGKIQVPNVEPDAAPQDSTATDSAKVADSTKVADTTKVSDTTKVADSAKVEPAIPAKPIKVYGEQITEIVVKDDCFYLICKKGTSCPDSRELGYFTRNQIIGSHVVWPDKIKAKFIEPVMKRVRFAKDIVVDVWTRAMNWADKKIEWIKEKIKSSDDKKEDDEDSEESISGPHPKKHSVEKN